MSAPVLERVGLSRIIDGRAIVDGVDLRVAKGEAVALLGASGSGKSTLLRMLAGLEPLDAGAVWQDGSQVASPLRRTPPEARGVCFVFQDFALFPHLSARDNIAFGLRRRSKVERAAVVDALITQFDLNPCAKAFPQTLSGGEQQRVALARALAPGPSVVLLDEPFSSLDARLRRSARETTATALRETGAAAVFVTHDAEEAMAFADTLVLIDEGRLIQTGDPASVYHAPVSAQAARLTGDVNVWRGVVRDGCLTTPFGRLTSDLPDGATADGLVRPEAVTLGAGGPVRIVDRWDLGSVVELAIAFQDDVWRARMPIAGAQSLGETCSVADLNGCVVAKSETDKPD